MITTDTKTKDEEGIFSVAESVESTAPPDLDRVDTVDIDNYHGLSFKVVVVYLSICLVGLSQLMTLVGAGAFARDVASSLNGIANSVWLAQTIAIVTVALGPPVSEAADLWGRKWFLVVLTACGFIGSMTVARASSMSMAIAGHTICGMAFGVQPLLYAVASEILPRRYRPAAQGGLNATLGMGGILALTAGSAMVRDFGFRSFYYLLAGMLAVSSSTCALLYNPPQRPLQKTLTTSQKLRRLDWATYFLLVVGIVLFVMGLSWAKNPYSWTSAHVLAPLLIGAAFIVALLGYQTFFKKNGLFHHDLFRRNAFRSDRNFGLALLSIFIDGMAFYAATNYYPFEMSVLFETDPVRIGLRFSLVFFAAIVASLLVAIYSSITKDVRFPVIASFASFVVFFGCMTSLTTGSSTAAWIYPVILGLGLGMSLTCLITLAQLSTPPHLIAITSGLFISIRSLGASVGLAIYTSIFNTKIAETLGKDIAAAVLPLGLPPQSLQQFIGALASHNEAALMAVEGVTPQIIGAGVHALQTAYLKAFKNVWIAAAVVSAVATIASCLFVEPKTITMHVDAPLEQEDS